MIKAKTIIRKSCDTVPQNANRFSISTYIFSPKPYFSIEFYKHEIFNRSESAPPIRTSFLFHFSKIPISTIPSIFLHHFPTFTIHHSSSSLLRILLLYIQYTILPISLSSFFTFLYLRFQQLLYPSLVHFTYLLFHILSYPLLIQFSYLPPFISSILPFHQLSYTLHSSNCSSFIFLIHIIYISHRSFIPPIFLSSISPSYLSVLVPPNSNLSIHQFRPFIFHFTNWPTLYCYSIHLLYPPFLHFSIRPFHQLSGHSFLYFSYLLFP